MCPGATLGQCKTSVLISDTASGNPTSFGHGAYIHLCCIYRNNLFFQNFHLKMTENLKICGFSSVGKSNRISG